MDRKKLAKLSAAYDKELSLDGPPNKIPDAEFVAKIEKTHREQSRSWRTVMPRLAAAAVVLFAIGSTWVSSTRSLTQLADKGNGWKNYLTSQNYIFASPKSKLKIDENNITLEEDFLVLQSIPENTNSSAWQTGMYHIRDYFGANFEVINNYVVYNRGTKFIATQKENKLHLMVLKGSIEVSKRTATEGQYLRIDKNDVQVLTLQNTAKLEKLTGSVIEGSINTQDVETLDLQIADELAQKVSASDDSSKEPNNTNKNKDIDFSKKKSKPKPTITKTLTRLVVEGGSTLMGDVVSEDAEKIILQVQGSEITIQKKSIVSRKKVQVQVPKN